MVILTAIEMTRRRRIPFPWLLVLAEGTLLQKQLAVAIEDEDMNRAVHQALSMNFTTSLDRDDIVIFINDIEQFVTD
jgi:hypothetical protein